jgi:aspartate--ammonia ligase
MTAEQRTLAYLRNTVERIYAAILRAEYYMSEMYPQLKPYLPEEIHFVHSEELRRMYPGMTAKQREDAICEAYGAVFIVGIGGKLGDGREHDMRAPDYDDWSTPNEDGFNGLNGDLLIWYPLLRRSIELSSMGIRVDAEALERQLALQGKEERRELFFHKRLLNGELPLSIGGGIGQSRLCMILLQKAHIGETQASIWSEEMRQECMDAHIALI